MRKRTHPKSYIDKRRQKLVECDRFSQNELQLCDWKIDRVIHNSWSFQVVPKKQALRLVQQFVCHFVISQKKKKSVMRLSVGWQKKGLQIARSWKSTTFKIICVYLTVIFINSKEW